MEFITPAHDLILESSLLKLPQELLKTNFKNQQKTIEKDIAWLQNGFQHLSGASASHESAKQLEMMIARLRNLKRRILFLQDDEASMISTLHTRVSHMNQLVRHNKSLHIGDKAEESRRVKRMLIEFMLRQGLSKTARKLATDAEMERLLDIDVFISSQRIANLLRDKSTQECITWCNEHKNMLKKTKHALEFELRRQEFIELIRCGKLHEAIAFAQKHLTNHRATRKLEVDQVCALLCYKPDTDVEPYKSLYSPLRWQYLADLFIQTHNELYNIPSISPLEVALSAGMSALKTAHCHVSDSGQDMRNLNATFSSTCPVCSPELNDLAQEVPIAHAARSHLVDALNGEAMEGENEPVVLPTGRIYGAKTLRDWAEKHPIKEGVVMDPMTGEEFSQTALRKAYVL